MAQAGKLLIAALCCFAFSEPSISQQKQEIDYPNKPVRLIIPLPPGGAVDITARLLGARLGERLKQQFVAENIPGASGVVAAETVARASPNGHTLFFGTPTTMVILPLINKDLRYQPLRDFEPVSLVVSNPFLLAVPSSLPINSAADLVALAKAKPGTLNYGTAGEGTPQHIAFELLMSMAGIDMVHVPYKGGQQAQVDLVSGRIQMYLSAIPGMAANVKAGKLKAIAVTTSKRASALPEVPTMSESGVPGYNFDTWYAVFATGKTPAPIIEKLNNEIVGVLSNPELIKSMASQGSDLRSSTPAALAGIIRAETERLGELVRKVGLNSQ